MRQNGRWILIACVVLFVAGLADRVLYIRRYFSPVHTVGVSRVKAIPESIGTWAGETTVVDEALLKTVVASGKKVLQFRDGKTGNSIFMAVLVGPPGLMTEQPPEKSYRAAGFAFDNESLRHHVLSTKLGVDVPGEIASMEFWSKESKVPLRVWQAWFDGKKWSRPDYARWQYLSDDMLYRLQVWSLMTTDPLATDPNVLVDPCRQFLIDALPTITETLLNEAKKSNPTQAISMNNR
jgi:hypothetical protein